MPKVAPLQSDFSGGEWSSFLEGRVDAERYKTALKKCENYLPMVQGPLIRRPGTVFVFPTKDNGVARLQRFEFSTTQAYMLEFGNNYVRFFKDYSNIVLSSKNITNITKANPAVVTSNSHGFSNGDRVVIQSVLGMTQVNNREFTVAGVTANTFQLSGVNSTSYTTYTSGGTASEIYEIASDFTSSEVFDIKFTQSADTLYLAHPDHPPKKLLRFGHTDWEFRDLDLIDGPYLSENDTQTTITPSAATGSTTLTAGPSQSISNAANNGSGLIRITASSHGFSTGDSIYITGVTGTTEANGTWAITVISTNTFDLKGSAFVNAYIAAGTATPALFASTDVGRSVRTKQGTTWGWAVITAYSSPISVTADVKETLTSTAAKTSWRLGTYSDTTGYPSTVEFHEDRLFLAGADGAPEKIDGSKSGDYENFTPTALDSTVASDNAVSFSFNSREVNKVRWLTSDEKGLLAGTVAAEWVVRPSSQGEALTPTNISAKKFSSWGSENVQPLQAGKATLYNQISGRKLREISYFYEIDGFRAADLTELALHILPDGVKQFAYQKSPLSFIWAVRNDGTLASLTYDRSIESLKAGWSRHPIGGFGDSAQSPASVESAQVIPSPDGERDDLWLIVQRYINGSVVRYIEYMDKIFEDTDNQRDAYFLDSGLTYDAPVTITDITEASPPVVTANSHGFSNGDKVLINGVVGLKTTITDSDSATEGVTYLVANKTTNTFELHDLDDNAVDFTALTPYVSDGEVRKMVMTIEGLNHLEGQEVDILADGAVHPSKTVTSGAITLDLKAATIHIGFGYNSDGQLLRTEAGSADGTALGKTRRVHRLGMVLERSLGLKIGYSFDSLYNVIFRTAADKMTRAPALYSGIISENVDANYDFNNTFCFRQSQPLPSTILAIMPQMVTQDG
ncbi:MAG TPA: ubiquitin-activating E1 FCCH domain-containing protein [Rhabdochlamydiaceae bacterium]|nr:ubiquitin-activating E1 FCCH domain-containing protein [Rhabdochlamydiaceae bacterium]